jgi:hypothetical protein
VGHVSRSTTLLGAGAALALTGLGVLLWPDARVEAQVGSVSTPQGPVTAEPVPSSTAATGEAERGFPAATVLEAAPAGFVPSRLAVDALGLDAPLLATAVDGRGALVPPEDPGDLGWWRGVRPGDGEGSVIVTGHIDSSRFGQGPLARIVDLQPGDRAVLAGADGATAAYAVRGVETYPKEALPAADLFGAGGPERLVLVTCGGTFDPGQRGWDSNVVAVLDPV